MRFLSIFKRKTPFIEDLPSEEYQFHITSFIDSLKYGGTNPYALAFQEHMLGIIKEGRPDSWDSRIDREEPGVIDVTPERPFRKKIGEHGQISYVRE